MASLLAGGITKGQQEDLTAHMYPTPPSNGPQYPPQYSVPPTSQPQYYDPAQPAYAIQPQPTQQYAPPPQQSTTVNMNGVQYAAPSYAPGFNPAAVKQSVQQGLEETPEQRQAREARAKLTELNVQDRMQVGVDSDQSLEIVLISSLSRGQFLRKVYGILLCQLGLTAVITALCMYAGTGFKVRRLLGSLISQERANGIQFFPNSTR
jgi:hypothetical protein